MKKLDKDKKQEGDLIGTPLGEMRIKSKVNSFSFSEWLKNTFKNK